MQFYEEKEAFALAEVFLRRLERDLFCAMRPLAAAFAPTPGYVPFADMRKLDYRPIVPGTIWGKTWDTGCFSAIIQEIMKRGTSTATICRAHRKLHTTAPVK